MQKLPGYKITLPDGTEAERIPMRLKQERMLAAPPYRTKEQREQMKKKTISSGRRGVFK